MKKAKLSAKAVRRERDRRVRKQAKAVVKPPKRLPRQPKLSGRRARKPNGPVGDVFTPDEPIDLGAIKLPSPDASVEVLRGLGKQHDLYAQADKAWKELKEKTKAAREKRDELLNAIVREIKVQTHESSFPILQLAEQEADQEAMEDAAANGGEIGEAANTEPF